MKVSFSNAVTGFGGDFRRARRSVRRYAVESLCLVALCALCAAGTGVTTGVLASIQTLELPYYQPQQLYHVIWRAGDCSRLGNAANELVPSRVTEALLAIDAASVALAATTMLSTQAQFKTAGAPVRSLVMAVSPTFLSVLGSRPILGHVPTGSRRESAYAVLTYDGWDHGFARDSSVIGRVITVDDQPFVVAAVMPRGVGSGGIDAWVSSPAGFGFGHADPADAWVIVRVADGANVSAVAAHVRTVAGTAASGIPNTQGQAACLMPMAMFRHSSLPGLLMVVYTAIAVLVLATAASFLLLLLARNWARCHNTLIELSLGASRWRVMRWRIVESLLLGAMGSVIALVLASWAYQTLRLSSFGSEIWFLRPSVPPMAIGAAMLLPLAMCVGSAVAAELGTRVTLSRVRISGAGASRPRGAVLARRLVALQIGLAVLVLTTVIANIVPVLKRKLVNRGFDDTHIALTRVIESPKAPGGVRAPSRAEVEALLRTAPGVSAAGALELMDSGRVDASGSPHPNQSAKSATPRIAFADPMFFAALGLRAEHGRLPSAAEVASGAPVAVLSHSAAIELFGQKGPDGRAVSLDVNGQRQLVAVIGVVPNADVSQSVREMTQSLVYLPLDPHAPSATVYARTDLTASKEAGSLSALLESRYGEAAPEVHAFDLFVDLRLSGPRAALKLLMPLAVITWIAAVLGSLGMILRYVQQSNMELGIRAALGATNRQNRLLVIRRVAPSLAVGVVFGGALAFVLGTVVSSMLRISPVARWMPLAASCAIAVVIAAVGGWPIIAAARDAPQALLHTD